MTCEGTDIGGGYNGPELRDEEITAAMKAVAALREKAVASADYDVAARARDLAQALHDLQLIRFGHSILLDSQDNQ